MRKWSRRCQRHKSTELFVLLFSVSVPFCVSVDTVCLFEVVLCLFMGALCGCFCIYLSLEHLLCLSLLSFVFLLTVVCLFVDRFVSIL